MESFKLSNSHVKDLYRFARDLRIPYYKRITKQQLVEKLQDKLTQVLKDDGNKLDSCESWLNISNNQVKKIYRVSPDVSLNKQEIVFEQMFHDSILPVRKSLNAAGFDLSSHEDVMVPPLGKALLRTGVKVFLPRGTYGRIAPRSGLAYKHFIDVGAGVIDADYTGEIMVLLFNFNNDVYEVKKGDRIAQLICERCAIPDEHPDDVMTERGAKGFGSSGEK